MKKQPNTFYMLPKTNKKYKKHENNKQTKHVFKFDQKPLKQLTKTMNNYQTYFLFDQKQ